MIDKFAFRRKSIELGFPMPELNRFYDGAIKIFAEIYKESPNWKTILEVEENSLWPILKTLSTRSHPIFDGADEVIRNEFTNSIRDELQIRSGKKLSKDAQDYLKSLIKKRLEFLEIVFAITPDDIEEFKKEEASSWVKWLLGGAVAIGGVIIAKKTYDHLKNGKK